MVDWLLETGLYLLGVAVVPLVGLLLVCFGLWGDRSKGRSRCPKCWYDMRGTVPRLKCPECGHAPADARGLYKNRRRWRRIALGVALVLLSSYPLTIVGGWYREQSAIQALTAQGYGKATSTVRPDWLKGRLPENFARLFDRAEGFLVPGGRALTDAGLSECGKLWHLRSLQSQSRADAVTDAGLAHLKGLTELRGLMLTSKRITDAGLAHLKGLSQLRSLSLSNAQVTDAGLVHLKRMSKLETLDLSDTQVTDEGLAHLRGLPRLQQLGLDRTQVTDAGLVQLQGLPQLQHLYLSETQVTDAGLVYVAGLSQLQGLDLSGTQVTDAGLVHLEGLTQLKLLNLAGTQVTHGGEAILKQALPELSISPYYR